MKTFLIFGASLCVICGCAVQTSKDVQQTSTQAAGAPKYELKEAKAPYDPANSHDSRPVPQRMKGSPSFNADKAFALAKTHLAFSKSIVASRSRLLSKAQASQEFNLKLDFLSDDSEVWAVELKGDLCPPEYSLPIDEQGKPVKLSYAKGIMLVNPETGAVVETHLYKLSLGPDAEHSASGFVWRQ